MREILPGAERLKQVEAVDKLTASGMTTTDALEKVGMGASAYYFHKSKLKSAAGPRKALPAHGKLPKRVRKPEMLTLTLPEESTPMVVLIGMPKDVSHALDRLASIRGGK